MTALFLMMPRLRCILNSLFMTFRSKLRRLSAVRLMPVRIVALTVTILLSLSAAANSESKADTIGVEVYFRQGYSRLQPSFHGNGARLEDFIRRVREIYNDTAIDLTSIEIKAYASPEGPYELNQRLARKRAARLADYLRENLTFLPDSIINVEAGGINWSGLARCVAASDMKYRQDVLDLIKNVPENTRRNGRIVDSRQPTASAAATSRRLTI